MRELTTIGTLRTQRTIERQSRLMPLMHIGWLGQTNPAFAPPVGLNALTMGPALSDALNTLLQTYTASGVPSEHTADPTAGAFQQAWNADPMVAAAGGNALLATDEGYGANTAAAVAAINGGSFPAVNTGGGAIVPASPSAPATPSVVTPAAPMAASHKTALWILAIVAAAAAAYAAHRMMKKKRARRRSAALPSRAIVLT